MNDNQRLFDTNILVYAYDISERQKHPVSRSVIRGVWQKGGGVVTLQNLAEFFVVITAKVEKPIPISVARDIVADFIESDRWTIIDRDEVIFLKSINFVHNYNIHLWDALIAACMVEYGIKAIVTENEKDFKRIPGITVINPFK